MGLITNYKKKRAETKAFKAIVNPRLEAAKRRSYEQEALKVAEEKGKAAARQGSFAERMGTKINAFSRPSAPIRRAPIRRAPIRRAPVRRAPVRRASPRRRLLVKRSAPVRRRASPRRRRAPVQQAEQKQSPYREFDIGSLV